MQANDHPCDVSPFCGSGADLLGGLRLPSDLPWRWAHLGPITVDGVCLVEHYDGDRWTTAQTLETGAALARFGGYHLDVLGLDVLGAPSHPPTFPATYHTLLKRWYVYAVAWRDADGPSVVWRVERFGSGAFIIRQPAEWPDADAIVGRCKDLLLGRFVRRGRPPKSQQARCDDLKAALLVDQIKLEHPKQRRADIARGLGFHPRTIRRIRAEAPRGERIDEAEEAG